MSFKTRLAKIWNGFEDLFLKNHSCISCRREIVDGTNFSLCKNCFEEIEMLSGNLCKVCGDSILEDNIICDRCKLCDYSFDENKSFAVYEDVAAKIVKRFKYSGKKYYAKHLAELMVLNRNYFENIDVISFVPIGEKRRKGVPRVINITNNTNGIVGIDAVNSHLYALFKVGNRSARHII